MNTRLRRRAQREAGGLGAGVMSDRSAQVDDQGGGPLEVTTHRIQMGAACAGPNGDTKVIKRGLQGNEDELAVIIKKRKLLGNACALSRRPYDKSGCLFTQRPLCRNVYIVFMKAYITNI